MSRKAKKKKVLDENGEKPPEDLLFYFDNVPTVTVFGQVLQRIPYEGTTNCENCHVEPGRRHMTHCFSEICPYCRGTAVLCKCDPDIQNAELDLFVECKI